MAETIEHNKEFDFGKGPLCRALDQFAGREAIMSASELPGEYYSFAFQPFSNKRLDCDEFREDIASLPGYIGYVSFAPGYWVDLIFDNVRDAAIMKMRWCEHG